MSIHALVPREIDSKTKQDLEGAETEEQQLAVAQDAAKAELDKIAVDLEKTRTTICNLIDEFNKIALSHNFVAHIQSAIRTLETHREELRSKTNTDKERELVERSINKLKEKQRYLEK
jgi:flagellar biosynthesis chaperone FliJ